MHGDRTRPLPIGWKRLVNEGETCPRCGSTQRNVLAAIAKLEGSDHCGIADDRR